MPFQERIIDKGIRIPGYQGEGYQEIRISGRTILSPALA